MKLTSGSTARKKVFDFDFSELEIKGRGAGGNILTKYPVRKVEFKAEGVSTLTGVDIWYDKVSGRLNRDSRGQYVGNFNGDGKIVAVYSTGEYEITGYELTHRYEADKIIAIAKLEPNLVLSAVHVDGESKNYYVKRFTIETNTSGKRFSFINESKGSSLVLASVSTSPKIELTVEKGKGKGKTKEVSEHQLDELIDVKGWKANGNRLSSFRIKKIKLLDEEQLIVKPKPAVKKDKDPIPESELSEIVESKLKEDDDTQKDLFAADKKAAEAKEAKPKPKPKAKPKPKKSDDDDSYEIGSTIELF